jgi:hypothetical protein
MFLGKILLPLMNIGKKLKMKATLKKKTIEIVLIYLDKKIIIRFQPGIYFVNSYLNNSLFYSLTYKIPFRCH